MADVRMDHEGLYAALDSLRVRRRLSWRRVAGQAGVSPSVLTRLSQGHSLDVKSFLALVHWLSVPAETFMIVDDRPPRAAPALPPRPDLATELRTLLRSRDELDTSQVAFLSQLFALTLRWFNDQPGSAPQR